jgi:hypothetical protein
MLSPKVNDDEERGPACQCKGDPYNGSYVLCLSNRRACWRLGRGGKLLERKSSCDTQVFRCMSPKFQDV